MCVLYGHLEFRNFISARVRNYRQKEKDMTKQTKDTPTDPIPEDVHAKARRIAKALLRPVKKPKSVEKSTEGEENDD